MAVLAVWLTNAVRPGTPYMGIKSYDQFNSGKFVLMKYWRPPSIPLHTEQIDAETNIFKCIFKKMYEIHFRLHWSSYIQIKCIPALV